MKIRQGALRDVPRLHQLIESAYRGDSARQGWTHEADLLRGQRTDEAALIETLQNRDKRILVAESEGEMVGSVQVESHDAGLAYLGQLAVDPGKQGGGIGTFLIKAAEALAVELFAADRMEMTVIKQRPELLAYYVRRGYDETVEMRPFPFDDDRVGIAVHHDLSFTLLSKALRRATP